MLTIFTWLTGLMLIPYGIVGVMLTTLTYRKNRLAKKVGLKGEGFMEDYWRGLSSLMPVLVLGSIFGYLNMGEKSGELWFFISFLAVLFEIVFLFFSLFFALDILDNLKKYKSILSEQKNLNRFSAYFGKMNLGNRNRFKRLFNLYPFEHPQKYTEYELDKNRDEKALIQIAKAYNHLVELEMVHAALPDVSLMRAEDKASVKSLTQQINELNQALQESGEFIRSLIVKNEDIHFSEKQLKAMKKLRTMSVQPTAEKTFIHPTLEALIQVQTMPGVSADRVQEAKRLEAEVKQLLKQKKTPWNPNELADTNLNAVKLHHGIQ